MNERKTSALADAETPKQKWVVKKLPIKGGSVIRSANLVQDDEHTPQWAHVEGKIES